MSKIQTEGALNLPIEELESFDNRYVLKQVRMQIFKLKRVKNKLIDLPISALQEMIAQKELGMQLRNFE